MTQQPSQPGEPGHERSAGLVRSEEELRTGTEVREAGTVRIRKVADTEHVSEVVTRDVEHADVEHAAPHDDDSGEIETLPDGSVSIPVFEERVVVEKRLVVRERIVLRKRTVTEEQPVEAELRRERVEIDVDEAVRDRVGDQGGLAY